MKAKQPRKGSIAPTEERPSGYKVYVAKSDEIADQILERVAEGRSIVKTLAEPGMPTYTAWMRWLQNDPDLVERYARAKDDSADAHADKITNVAEKVESGELDPQAGRVVIDAMKWTAAKLKPKRYGDFQRTEISGPDGGAIVTQMSDDQLDGAITALMVKLKSEKI